MDNILFRCSGLGNLLTDPRSKAEKEAGELSQTTKTYLKEVFIQQKYGRRKDIESKFLDKGNEGEETSFDLLSTVSERLLMNNKQRNTNEYVTGEWDSTHGETVIDVKTSWDIFTFGKAEVTKGYEAQLNGYMWLLDFPHAELSYCLIDTPEHLILDMFRRETWKRNEMDIPDQDKREIAINHIYTQDFFDVMKAAHFPQSGGEFIPVPAKDRIKTFKVERDDEMIDKLKLRIDKSRDYLKTLTL